MNYQIIVTLGPSSHQVETWASMISLGCSAFRLNTSHLSLVQLKTWMTQLDQFFQTHGVRIPIILDLQGSKWRLGTFPAFELVPGQQVHLVQAEDSEQEYCLPVPHPDFFLAARQSGSVLVLNDGKNRLKITKSQPGSLIAEVLQGGPITSRKGITFSRTSWRRENLFEKDLEIISSWSAYPDIRFAISYIRDAEECKRYRQLFPTGSYLISKLERPDSMRDSVEIAAYSDELWICRGDLGAELGFAKMAIDVDVFDRLLPSIDKPVFMAGQVLEHLTGHETPTRAEVCDLYHRIQLGYSGVVLSDETAIGRHPVNACALAALFRMAPSLP